MNSTPMRSALFVVALAGVIAGCAGTPAARDDMFVTRSSAKSPADLHQAIRNYVQQKNWQYIGDNKIKGGQVTQVRICDPKAASDIWSAGMKVSAMLPCGHMSVYQEDGVTKVTLLSPRFLARLDPHPAVKKLAEDVSDPFTAMLDEVTR
jgi:hypothetical protein